MWCPKCGWLWMEAYSYWDGPRRARTVYWCPRCGHRIDLYVDIKEYSVTRTHAST